MRQDEFLDRLNDPRMEYYHKIYKDSPRWDGSQIVSGKKIIVYCEQGLGDIIQTARYFRPLRQFGCKIILHAQEELKSLFVTQTYIDDFICKGEEIDLPPHDFHILSLSLPFLMAGTKINFPYMEFAETNEDVDKEYANNLKIGITWEGKTRSIELKHFRELVENDNTKLFMVQKEIRDKKLIEGCEDMELLGTEIHDMKDTARLINSMNFLVTVDTCILHLAGALHKKTYGIMNQDADPRWKLPLYQSVRLLKADGEMKPVMKTILKNAT